jgi:succinate dehydrogenase/fumarate reductase cytochrome b subunit
MRKIIFTIFYIFALTLSSHVYAQTGDYTTLAPLPGTTKSCSGTTCTADINSYLGGFLGLVITIGAVLAMVYLGLYGFQYAVSDSAPKKSDYKDKIFTILQGLLLILCAYTIMQAINPKLVEVNLQLTSPKLQAVPAVATTTGGTPTTSTAPTSLQTRITETCPNCGPLTGTSYSISQANIQRLNCTTCIPFGDLPVSSGNLNKNIEPDMKNRLLALKYGLGQQNISWGVTEGYPPVTDHRDDCHYNGTCIDAVIQDSSPATVRDFIATANNNGLRAQFEVRTDAEKNSMISRLKLLGMSNAEATAAVITVPTINGNHFSVYKK